LIVRCAKCETRFKLDETRLPARGARVRCSRCKNAFFVTPPQANQAAVVQELAEEVTQGRSRAPEPAWDLDSPERTQSRARSEGERRARTDRSLTERGAALSAPEVEDDSDWTFEDRVPGLAGDASSLDLPDGGAEGAPLGEDPNESSFAGLGEPESWDLLAQTPPSPTPAPAPPPATPAPARRAAQPDPPAEVVAREAPVPKPAPVQVSTPVLLESTPKSVTSWLSLAGVAALGIALLWGSVHASARAEAVQPLAPLAGLEVASARARRIENAQVGPILVVSGELRNPGPGARSFGSRLVVTLLDASGAAVDAPEAVAAAPLGEERLREDDPKRLRGDQERASVEWAARELPAGATLAFDAVFESVPAAARFDLAAKPIPAPRASSPAALTAPAAAAPSAAMPAAPAP